MDADFVCTNLPPWLEWRAGVLAGMPPEDACSLSLEIVAEYSGNNKLTQIFSIPVVADNGIRQLSGDAILASSEATLPNMLTFTTKAAPALHESTNSSSGSELTASTNSVQTPPAYIPPPAPASTPALMPSPMHAMTGMPMHAHINQSKMQSMQQSVQSQVPGAMVPTSPQQVTPYANAQGGQHYLPPRTDRLTPQGNASAPITAPGMPLCMPTNPTDATTLASASQIKAKLVEVTTNHHGNLSALDPAHPPADPYKVSVAVDAAISHQLAVTAARPQMPSATEVFNATLEVSTRSQQMQQEQLSQVVAAVTHSIQQSQQMYQQQVQVPQHQQPPMHMQMSLAGPHQQHMDLPQQIPHVSATGMPLSAQVTSQLADFSFTPCNTPGVRSPETQHQARMQDFHAQ